MAPAMAQDRGRAGPRFRIRRRRGQSRQRSATRRFREPPWQTRRRRRDEGFLYIAVSPRWCSRSCSPPSRRNRLRAVRGRRPESGIRRLRSAARHRRQADAPARGSGGRRRWSVRLRECPSSAASSVSAFSVRWLHPSRRRGACHRARIRATRWRLLRMRSSRLGRSWTLMVRSAATPRVSNHEAAMRSGPDNKMTARGGQTLLVAIDLLAFFVALLRLHRERRDRARLQPLQRGPLAGLLAIAVGVVVDALQRRVDLGDQLALTVAGAQFDRAVGFGGSAVRQIRMIDVLFLERLQRDPRFLQDLVLPRQQLGAKIIALAVVHERLFFGGSITFQLFQGPAHFHVQGGPKRVGPRAPYIAVSCDRQYRPRPRTCARRGFPRRNL